MRECLAVSDAQAGTLTVYSLPSLSPCLRISLSFSPGVLFKRPGEDTLWCAEHSGSRLFCFSLPAFEMKASFYAAPESEGLFVSGSDRLLFLSGGADSIQSFCRDGTPLCSNYAGVHPRQMCVLGHQAAVAAGAQCALLMFDSHSLLLTDSHPLPGIACGVCSLGGVWFSLCARGEYEPDALIVPRDASGRAFALPGLPGAIAPCGGGLLISHLGWLTLLESSCGRIRWQTHTGGLASEIIASDRFAAFLDPLDGSIGTLEMRRGRLLAKVQSPHPAGAALL